MLNVKIHASISRKRLNKHGSFGRVAGESLFLLNRFVKLRLNKLKDLWNNVLWTDETKVEMFGHNAQQHVWRKPNTAYQHKHLIPTVKHCGAPSVHELKMAL